MEPNRPWSVAKSIMELVAGSSVRHAEMAIADAGVVDRKGLIALMRNGFLGSILSYAEVRMYLDSIDTYEAACWQ